MLAGGPASLSPRGGRLLRRAGTARRAPSAAARRTDAEPPRPRTARALKARRWRAQAARRALAAWGAQAARRALAAARRRGVCGGPGLTRRLRAGDSLVTFRGWVRMIFITCEYVVTALRNGRDQGGARDGEMLLLLTVRMRWSERCSHPVHRAAHRAASRTAAAPASTRAHPATLHPRARTRARTGNGPPICGA